MSFGTKYKTPFYDFSGNGWELRLAQVGYASTEYTLKGGASPVVIIDPNQGENKLIPIRGTELKANLFIDTNAAYDFQADFTGITDREWQALLYRAGASTYLAECEITTLNISSNSVDATGTITITNEGDVATKPTCPCRFSIFTFPTLATQTLSIYAVPYDEDNQSANRKFLGSVPVLTSDSDTETIIDKIAALSADFTKLAADEFQYQQSTLDDDIDVTWNVKIDYWEEEWKAYGFFSSAERFNGSTSSQWIMVDLHSKQINQDNPEVINLATHLFATAETINDVALSLKNKIDGDTGVNIYYPTTGELINITFEATVLNNVVTITLGGIGAKGNYFNIKEAFENDTYIRIYDRTGSDYTWTDVDFSGGSDAGDEFKIEVDQGAGNVAIGTTLAYGADTEATIIARLVTEINNNNELFTAEVDSVDDAKLNFTTDSAVGWTYKFSTDGASTVTPSTDTAFTVSTNDVIKWTGWVIPGIYEQEHLSGVIRVELSAVDGIGDLKNFTFEVNDSRPFEKLSFIKIISFALEKTGFNLRIYESFNLWHLQADSSLSPLEQTYQDTSRLNGVSCYKVLLEIAILLKATIIQRDGRWELLPLDLLGADYTTRIFDNYGNYIESITTTGFIKEVGGTARVNIFLNRSPKIAFEPAYRKVKVKQDFGFVNQLLKFPSFISINDNLSNLEYPWNWLYNSIIQTSFLGEIKRDSDNYLYLSNNIDHNATQFYVQQKVKISDVTLSESESTQYEFKLTYKQDTNGAASFDIIGYIINNAETDTVWLIEDTSSNLSSVTNTITLNGNESNSIKTLTIKFNYPTASVFDAEPSTFYIEIYQPTADFVKIKTVELKINTISVVGKKVSSEYTELVDDLSSNVFEETIKIGDIPNTSNAQEIYKNALFFYDADSNLNTTSSWVLDPDTPLNQKPIIGHLRQFILDAYPVPLTRLTADVLGDAGLRDILKDKSNSDKLFMLMGGEKDIKTTVMSGEWQEIDIDVSGYTLAETTESYEEDSSGSNAYTSTQGGTGPETPPVDLSNYYTKQESNALIVGATGTFTGADLTARAITLVHNLAIETVILYLYDNNNNMLNQSNFEIDTAGELNSLILTVHMPVSGGDVFKYRIL